MSALNPIYVVVTNANVLINLIHIDRLDLLGALASYEFVVPPEVEAEIRVPDYSRALARAFDADRPRCSARARPGTAYQGMAGGKAFLDMDSLESRNHSKIAVAHCSAHHSIHTLPPLK